MDAGNLQKSRDPQITGIIPISFGGRIISPKSYSVKGSPIRNSILFIIILLKLVLWKRQKIICIALQEIIFRVSTEDCF